MSKTQVSRDVLREKRIKKSEINDKRKNILKESTKEILKKKNEELKFKIKELNDQIRFLTVNDWVFKPDTYYSR